MRFPLNAHSTLIALEGSRPARTPGEPSDGHTGSSPEVCRLFHAGLPAQWGMGTPGGMAASVAPARYGVMRVRAPELRLVCCMRRNGWEDAPAAAGGGGCHADSDMALLQHVLVVGDAHLRPGAALPQPAHLIGAASQAVVLFLFGVWAVPAIPTTPQRAPMHAAQPALPA